MNARRHVRKGSAGKAAQSGCWALFNAEAAYADSIFRTAIVDLRGAVAALLEAGHLLDAEKTLMQAVSMDPADALASENLRFCRAKLSELAASRTTPNNAVEPAAQIGRRRRARPARG